MPPWWDNQVASTLVIISCTSAVLIMCRVVEISSSSAIVIVNGAGGPCHVVTHFFISFLSCLLLHNRSNFLLFVKKSETGIWLHKVNTVFISFTASPETWCPPANWTGPLPVDFFPFQNGDRLQFMNEGNEDNMIVAGRVCVTCF